jgi:hypothetical protein
MRTESPCSSSQHRISSTVAFNKDAFPNAGYRQPDQIIQPAKTSPGFLA